MSANDFGDYLAILCGQQPLARNDDIPNPEGLRPDPNAGNTLASLQSQIEKMWPLPMRGLPLSQVMAEYRTKLMGAVAACRDFDGMHSDCIILSGEGIGKTTAHMHLTVQEALFTALDSLPGDPHRRFSVFAFRSLAQAKEKAEEAIAQTGGKVVVIQSFWNHYEEACKLEGLTRFRAQFPDRSVDGVLETIQAEQPAVFARLEEIRRNIWPRHGDKPDFDAADTLIFTSHPTASSWAFSQLTRTWYHPDFEPFMDDDEQAALRNQFVFDKVIYDEPEIDEVLHIIPEDLFRHLTEQHEAVNWNDLSVLRSASCSERLGVVGCFVAKRRSSNTKNSCVFNSKNWIAFKSISTRFPLDMTILLRMTGVGLAFIGRCRATPIISVLRNG